MKLHAVQFGTSPLYKRFQKVLELSAQKNSPNTPLEIHAFNGVDPSITSRLGRTTSGNEICNALKTKYHNEIVQNASEDEVIGMLDLDLVILNDLSSIEQEDFDLALTFRNQGLANINSGVVFVRISKKTKEWYEQWYYNVLHLLENNPLRKELKAKYLGINQSGLAMLLQGKHDLNILELPCEVWNCTPICFPSFGENTKIAHILGDAKKLVRGEIDSGGGKVREIVNIWKSFDNTARSKDERRKAS